MLLSVNGVRIWQFVSPSRLLVLLALALGRMLRSRLSMETSLSGDRRLAIAASSKPKPPLPRSSPTAKADRSVTSRSIRCARKGAEDDDRPGCIHDNRLVVR